MEKKKIEKVLSGENSFKKQVENALNGLVYISETDSEFFFFDGAKASEVSADELLRQIGKKDQVEEKGFYDLFDRLTEHKDWFGEEEKQMADKFSKLKKLLAENLVQKKVFRVGKIKLDIYIVGLDSDDNLKGVRTIAVET